MPQDNIFISSRILLHFVTLHCTMHAHSQYCIFHNVLIKHKHVFMTQIRQNIFYKLSIGSGQLAEQFLFNLV